MLSQSLISTRTGTIAHAKSIFFHSRTVSIRSYRHFALALLFIVGLLNYLDRYLIAILLPDMKTELGLSDTQIGLITGLAFSIFYAAMGIPIARMSDRFSRRGILSAALVAWSAMTAACGLVQNFAQLLIARILVGVGEAGATPASHSLISDYYPREERATALAIHTMTTPVGVMLGFLIGGLITEHFGWRMALFAFGVPGILVALLVYVLLKEPRRGESDGAVASAELPPFWPAWRALLARKTFFHLCMAGGSFSFMFIAVIQWLPSFFDRTHALSTSQIGTWLAFVIGIPQGLGLLTGGYLADRFARIDLRWPLWMSCGVVLSSTPFYFVVFLSDNPTLAFLALCPPFFLGLMQGGAQFSAIQNVAGVRMRSVAAGTVLLFLNLIGGLGPLAVGIASDLLFPSLGDDGLRYALLVVAAGGAIWTASHFYMASRTVGDDIAAVD